MHFTTDVVPVRSQFAELKLPKVKPYHAKHGRTKVTKKDLIERINGELNRNP